MASNPRTKLSNYKIVNRMKKILNKIQFHHVLYTVLCLVFLFVIFADVDRRMNKDTCIIVYKKYEPARTGTGEQSTNEKFLIYLKRKNGTNFMFGSKHYIIETNKDNYDKLKIGDTLANKY